MDAQDDSQWSTVQCVTATARRRMCFDLSAGRGTQRGADSSCFCTSQLRSIFFKIKCVPSVCSSINKSNGSANIWYVTVQCNVYGDSSSSSSVITCDVHGHASNCRETWRRGLARIGNERGRWRNGLKRTEQSKYKTRIALSRAHATARVQQTQPILNITPSSRPDMFS